MKHFLEQMSEDLQLPTAYILGIAGSASYRYKAYQIPKRSGGMRDIHHPSKELKALQRWLALQVINKLPVHDAATAYRPGRNVAHNASHHVANRFLLRMDFEDFFPSLGEDDIRRYCSANKHNCGEWSEEDLSLLCALSCRHGRLTIGAPTSPSLSNVLCERLDVALSQATAERTIVYTRYADDLFFSTSRPSVLRPFVEHVRHIVEEIGLPARLKVNTAKTSHSSLKRRRKVTGVILGSDAQLSVGRNLKREIKTLIFLVDTLTDIQRRRLAGLLGYCKMVEPDFINRLIIKFDPHRIHVAKNPKLPFSTVAPPSTLPGPPPPSI